VATKIGPIARPKTVIFTDELPKTRSGKIMRRLLRDVAEGRVLGDTTTLADRPWWRRSGACRRTRRRGVAAWVTRQLGLRHGRIEQPGRAVVFDMDGVLSDAVGRQHFIEEDGATGTRSSTPAARRRHRRAGARARAPRPRAPDHPPHRSADARPAPDAGWLERYDLRWDLLSCGRGTTPR